MQEFFTSNLDIVFFIYGLAFIILGISCHILSQKRTEQLPWKWLAAFGFIHGINEWLDLVALGAGDAPIFVLTRTAVMDASFVCLLLFGIEGRAALEKRTASMVAPLLLIACGLALRSFE